MKFPLPELMTPLSALGETSRARNARQGRAAPPGGALDTGQTRAAYLGGDVGGSGGSESRGLTHYRAAPRLRSKKSGLDEVRIMPHFNPGSWRCKDFLSGDILDLSACKDHTR